VRRPPWWLIAGILADWWARRRPTLPTPPGAPPFDPLTERVETRKDMIECVVCPPGTFVPRATYTQHLTAHARTTEGDL
jgi:hypothetical protein